MNAERRRSKPEKWVNVTPKRSMSLSVFICVHLWLIFLSSCSSKPTDMRALVPAETLIYLEANDLAAALQPVIDSKPFTESATRKPDLSALKGVQLAIAVTGFESVEEKVTEEQSVARIQPHFVAITDTHAWNYQANAFAEHKLGQFVTDIFGTDTKVELLDAKGGKYYAWTSDDGRKAFALVIDSLIYFSTDESAIDKCLEVKQGNADSIVKTGKLRSSGDGTLAYGYVSADGVGQIANLAGIKLASEASDESEVQSAIAGLLPQLIRSTVTDVTWTAARSPDGFVDTYSVEMPDEVRTVFSEAVRPGDISSPPIELIPANSATATYYNLSDPQIAFRSILLTAAKQTDAIGARVVGEFSSIAFEPYGIRDSTLR